MKLKLINLLIITNFILLFTFFFGNEVKSQTNSSTVTNSTSPSASSTTTGGTSINYQTNSSFTNDLSFGPGFVCRTPSLVVNGSVASADSENWAALGNSGTYGENITGSIGLVIPFGSKLHDHCETVAQQTARDKEISTQLSMIRACASLEKEGITVDPNKFPLLADCVVNLGEPDLSLNTKVLRDKVKNNNIKNQTALKENKKSTNKTKVPILIED